jgi:hypothetical protein
MCKMGQILKKKKTSARNIYRNYRGLCKLPYTSKLSAMHFLHTHSAPTPHCKRDTVYFLEGRDRIFKSLSTNASDFVRVAEYR